MRALFPVVGALTIGLGFGGLAACGSAPSAPTPSPQPAPAAAQKNDSEPPAPETPTAPSKSDDELHGELVTIEGQRVLRVWGTPTQMGYAHGYLLREAIIEITEDYALDVIPPASLNAAGALYSTVAHVPPRLTQEAEGIIAGMDDAGGRHIPRLDRDLQVADLLVLNAMTDLLAVGCSSVSAWEASTAADPELSGAPMMVRNLDWSDDDDLLRNQVVIAYRPSDPERQPVVSVAFAGYIGCLSCMNEAGVSALFNMGYGEGAASPREALGGFAPANLLLRDALERRDIDGDGRSRTADIETHWRANTHAGSYILHLIEPRGEGSTAPARVLEVEADGVVARAPAADKLPSTVLAATNHLRQKTDPSSCSRYAEIERTVKTSTGRFDHPSLWALGTRLRLPAVVHSLLVEPEARRLGVWLRSPGDRADSATPPVTHTWDALMGRSEKSPRPSTQIGQAGD